MSEKVWLSTYATSDEGQTFAGVVNPAAIAALTHPAETSEPVIARAYGARETTYERAYGDADGRSRASYFRALEEAERNKTEALRLAGIKAEARVATRRWRRQRLLTERLQGVLDLLLGHLRDERLAATRKGEHNRVASLCHQADEICDEFDKLVKDLAENLP
jgi:hypothetical protein